MLFWIIPLAIVLLIFMLCLTRVHLRLQYHPDNKQLTLRFLFIRRHTDLDAPPPEPKKPGKKKRKTKRKRAVPSVEELPTMLKEVLLALGRLLPHIRVDRLDAELIVSHPDPADAAIHFGRYNAAWHTLRPLIHRLTVRHEEVRILLDFEAETTSFRCEVKLSARAWAVVRAWAVLGAANLPESSSAGKARNSSNPPAQTAV